MIQRQKYKALSRSQLFSISVFITLALTGIASFDMTQQDSSMQTGSIMPLFGLLDSSSENSHSFQQSGLKGTLVETPAHAFHRSQPAHRHVTAVVKHKPIGEKAGFQPTAYTQP